MSKATVHILTKYSNNTLGFQVGCPVHPEHLLVGMEAERTRALTSEYWASIHSCSKRFFQNTHPL